MDERFDLACITGIGMTDLVAAKLPEALALDVGS